MKTYRHLFVGLFALATLFTQSFLAGPVYAQQSPSSRLAPRIEGFDVKPVRQLAPGNELLFTLYGSPGGTARVRINGAATGLLLEEVEPGVYEGSYTIKSRDRITPESTVTANLRWGNQVASEILDDPLVVSRAAAKPVARSTIAAAPKIDRFDVEPVNRMAPGGDLFFALSGTPGADASVKITGVPGKLVLDEVRSGVYEGTYVIKNRDRIPPDARVTGRLRIGNQESAVTLTQPLVASSAAPASARRTAARICANCGVVDAINVVEVKGKGNYIGMIAGGVAGALLGSQVGSGRGTTVAEVAGAAGGALAGNEIQGRVQTTKHYEVVVRLDGGGTQTISYTTQPTLRVGDKVKVENGALIPA
jgi:outer membrane lipoprotein SlyB